MDKHITWVVAANGAMAKLFRIVKFPKLEEFAILEHPESRLHDKDLTSALPGRNFDSAGGGSKHAYQQKTDPHRMEMEIFARFVADTLSSSYQKGEFSRLYLVASPGFLGMIRPLLNHNMQKAIIAEVSKDMVEHSVAEIEHHLANL